MWQRDFILQPLQLVRSFNLDCRRWYKFTGLPAFVRIATQSQNQVVHVGRVGTDKERRQAWAGSNCGPIGVQPPSCNDANFCTVGTPLEPHCDNPAR